MRVVDSLTNIGQLTITTIRYPPVPGKSHCRWHVMEPHTIGKLEPGVEARIVREDGSEADVNEPGELYVRSASISLGYWNDEKATRETFVDGWVRTKDIIRVDQNGYFL